MTEEELRWVEQGKALALGQMEQCKQADDKEHFTYWNMIYKGWCERPEAMLAASAGSQ